MFSMLFCRRIVCCWIRFDDNGRARFLQNKLPEGWSYCSKSLTNVIVSDSSQHKGRRAGLFGLRPLIFLDFFAPELVCAQFQRTKKLTFAGEFFGGRGNLIAGNSVVFSIVCTCDNHTTIPERLFQRKKSMPFLLLNIKCIEYVFLCWLFRN